MENCLKNTINSSKSAKGIRKSIFNNQKSEKSKCETSQPKLLINGQSPTQCGSSQSATSPQFFTPPIQKLRADHFQTSSQTTMEQRRILDPYFYPDQRVNRVVFSNPDNVQSIRPSSLLKKSIIVNSPQIVERPIEIYPQARTPIQKQVLGNSILIPSQTSNIIPAQNFDLTNTSGLKRKCILLDGRPHQNVIFRHSKVDSKPIEYITEMRPGLSKIIIQDNPQTISELNKLTSLNRFLTQQYHLINDELITMRNRISKKSFIDENSFLQKSVNKIEDIFLRETNQALYKLEQISGYSSAKGLPRISKSIPKKCLSPTFSNIKVDFGTQKVYSPIKEVEEMQNFSNIEYNNMDQKNV